MKLLATVLLGLSRGEIANCTAEYLTLNLDCSTYSYLLLTLNSYI